MVFGKSVGRVLVETSARWTMANCTRFVLMLALLSISVLGFTSLASTSAQAQTTCAANVDFNVDEQDPTNCKGGLSTPTPSGEGFTLRSTNPSKIITIFTTTGTPTQHPGTNSTTGACTTTPGGISTDWDAPGAGSGSCTFNSFFTLSGGVTSVTITASYSLGAFTVIGNAVIAGGAFGGTAILGVATTTAAATTETEAETTETTETTTNTVPEETQKAINNFMQNRANHLLSNQPRIGSLLGGVNNARAGDLNVDGNDDALQFAFASSLSQMQAYAGSDKSSSSKRIDGAFPIDSASSTYGDGKQFDVWAQIYGANSKNGDSRGKLWVGYFGAHYFVTPEFIVGALVQVDWSEETNASVNSLASGDGWMIGPYIAGKINSLTYEARVSWGRSENDINPSGTYTDNFETERFLASAKIAGDYKMGAWTLTPEASVLWFEETQEAYTDSLGNAIGEQTNSLGEVRLGPKFSYLVDLGDGSTMTPTFGISGVTNFGIANNAASQGSVLGNDDWRARFDGGLAFTNQRGWILALLGHYDGIGIDDYYAYGGGARLTIPLN